MQVIPRPLYQNWFGMRIQNHQKNIPYQITVIDISSHI
jgi:hypothetical protein